MLTSRASFRPFLEEVQAKNLQNVRGAGRKYACEDSSMLGRDVVSHVFDFWKELAAPFIFMAVSFRRKQEQSSLCGFTVFK